MVFFILLSLGIATLLSCSWIQGSINSFTVKSTSAAKAEIWSVFALQNKFCLPLLTVLCVVGVDTFVSLSLSSQQWLECFLGVMPRMLWL